MTFYSCLVFTEHAAIPSPWQSQAIKQGTLLMFKTFCYQTHVCLQHNLCYSLFESPRRASPAKTAVPEADDLLLSSSSVGQIKRSHFLFLKPCAHYLKTGTELWCSPQEAAATLPGDLKKLIKENGHYSKQVLNRNESALCWTKVTESTSIKALRNTWM